MEHPCPSVTDVTELYREGSAACRNYSTLTMQVRTMAQQVLIAGVIGLSVATLGLEFTGEELGTSMRFLGYILICGGAVLFCFGVSLGVVNWHYQSAFTAIRNVLAFLEGDEVGPWRAHWCIRKAKTHDRIASNFPFWILCLVGGAGVLVGFDMVNMTRSHPWWFGILIALGVIGVGISVYIARKDGDISVNKELCGVLNPLRHGEGAASGTPAPSGSADRGGASSTAEPGDAEGPTSQ
jgi:hypothetical protein